MPRRLVLTIGIALAGANAAAQPAALTLRDAIAEALQHSPELSAPEDQVVSADLQQRQARAPFALKWTPMLSNGAGGIYASRSYGVTLDKQLSPTGTDVWMTASALDLGPQASAYRDRGYSFGFSQPLAALFSGGAKAPLETARRTVARSERDLEDARRQLVVTVAEAFFAADATSRLVQASRRSVARAATLSEAAEARAKAGLDTELDVMRAQLLASQAQATLGDREDALASACEKLNAVLGRAIDAECNVAEESTDAGGPFKSDTAGPAISLRTDVIDARARVDETKRSAVLSRWNVIPPVTLSVEYDQRGLGSISPDLFRPLNGWHVSLNTTYQIDRSTQSASVAAADLAVKAAERDEAAVEQRALADIRHAERAVARADQNAVLQGQALRIAQQQAELAKLRYERGLADNFAVVDAENALFQAETASIAAEIDRRLSRLRLERASGTLDPSRLGS